MDMVLFWHTFVILFKYIYIRNCSFVIDVDDDDNVSCIDIYPNVTIYESMIYFHEYVIKVALARGLIIRWENIAIRCTIRIERNGACGNI